MSPTSTTEINTLVIIESTLILIVMDNYFKAKSVLESFLND